MNRPTQSRLNAAFARDVFDSALDQFLHEESDAIAAEISEQNSCGRLAIYLTDVLRQRQLKGYWVDVEYNRKQFGQIKTIINQHARVIPVRCDLIVHSRGNAGKEDNLIAVEMKKDRRPLAEREADRMRLEALTGPPTRLMPYRGGEVPLHVSGYYLGVFVILSGRRRQCTVEYFIGGQQVESRNYPFK